MTKVIIPCEASPASSNCHPTESKIALLAIAEDFPDKNKLDYRFIVTGGRVSSESSIAQWEMAGVAPGYYTAIITVTDARKNSATASITVSVEQCECPSACDKLSVTSPAAAGAGQPIKFVAVVDADGYFTYNWRISAGIISSGQATSTITVDPQNLNGQPITATLELGGVYPSCTGTATSTTTVAAASPLPSSNFEGMYTKIASKIARTNDLLAVRKAAFETLKAQQDAAAKPDKSMLCRSLAEWNLIYHDRIANEKEMAALLSQTLPEPVRTKTELLDKQEKTFLNDNLFRLAGIASKYDCTLTNKTSDGSESSYTGPNDFFDYFASKPEDPSVTEKSKAAIAAAIDRFIAESSVSDAEKEIGAGHIDAPLVALNALIQKYPDLSSAYVQRASIYWLQGKLDLAQADVDKALAADPKSAKAYYLQGSIDVSRGNTARALADNTKAIELDPKLAMAYYNRGTTNLNLGNLTLAVADLTKAIGLKPDYSLMYLNRGVANHRRGVLLEALVDIGKALDLEPSNVIAQRNFRLYVAELSSADLVSLINGQITEMNTALKVFLEKIASQVSELKSTPAKVAACQTFDEVDRALRAYRVAHERTLFIKAIAPNTFADQAALVESINARSVKIAHDEKAAKEGRIAYQCGK